MIGYFPDIYPDETVYSLLCRYWTHMGYPGYRIALEDLLQSGHCRLDIEFLGSIKPEIKEYLDKKYGLENLIYNNTMFKQYSRFMSNERKENALRFLKTGTDGNIHDLLCIPNYRNDRCFRYCPECVRKDRSIYGETYWHRAWFIYGSTVCRIHGCRLESTGIVISSNSSPRLFPADDVITDTHVIKTPKTLEKEFSEYLANVDAMPVNNTEPDIRTFFAANLDGTKYISVRGNIKKISQLFSDIQEFYKEYKYNRFLKLHHLQKVFLGANRHFLDICQLGYFLGITPESLSQMEMTGTESMCRNPFYDNRDFSVRKGMKKYDWDMMDRQLLSAVSEVCKKIYSGEFDNGRPHRVTESRIRCILQLPHKRFDYLPRCRSMISQYQESQEEYWAREVQWAYDILAETKGVSSINWSDIKNMTNLRRKNFEACLKYVKTRDIRNLKIN